MRRRGFTLIELLVVIAIIAILAAILFPVFAKARERARQTSCVSNMRQMAVAFLSYAQDFDEQLPLVWGPSENHDRWITVPPGCRASANPLVARNWANAIQPEIKSWNVYTCPSSAVQNFDNEGVTGPQFGCSYTFNSFLHAIPIGSITSPTKTIMCWEGVGRFCPINYSRTQPFLTAPLGWNVPWLTAGYAAGMFGRAGQDLHNGGVNKAFGDGHAKWTKEPGMSNQSVWARMNATNGQGTSYWVSGGFPALFRPDIQ